MGEAANCFKSVPVHKTSADQVQYVIQFIMLYDMALEERDWGLNILGKKIIHADLSLSPRWGKEN